MTNILVRPPELRQVADGLRSGAQRLGKSLQTIDTAIHSLNGQDFMGHRSDTLQLHYISKRESLLRAQEIVLRFAIELGNAAEVFEKADQNPVASLPVTAGLVLPKGWLLPILLLFPPELKPHFNWSFHPILPLHPDFDLIKGIEVPDWLKKKLDRIFPPPEVVSPLPPDINKSSPPTPSIEFGDLPKQEPSTVTNESNSTLPLSISHNVPTKSQGNLYGSAACAPTSVSMVLDYYHLQDNAHETSSPEELIAKMDLGDGTPGRGISLSNLTDELNDLGYHNISQKVDATFSDLQSVVQDGPVIVTAGVKIEGPGTIKADVPRSLHGPGNTIHAMVVTGIGDAVVKVNDPWTGEQIEFSKTEFEKMWSRGSSAYYSIRP